MEGEKREKANIIGMPSLGNVGKVVVSHIWEYVISQSRSGYCKHGET